jgi:DNA polymerase-3 subunit delta
MSAVADSARYSIADLSMAALNGECLRALRVLGGLRDEAVAEVLILWSLSQEIRAGARAAEANATGVGLDAALKSAGVWANRAGPMKNALARHQAPVWLSMLSTCTKIDRQIKGQSPGSVWDSFEALVTRLASRGDILIKIHQKIPA